MDLNWTFRKTNWADFLLFSPSQRCSWAPRASSARPPSACTGRAPQGWCFSSCSSLQPCSSWPSTSSTWLSWLCCCLKTSWNWCPYWSPCSSLEGEASLLWNGLLRKALRVVKCGLNWLVWRIPRVYRFNRWYLQEWETRKDSVSHLFETSKVFAWNSKDWSVDPAAMETFPSKNNRSFDLTCRTLLDLWTINVGKKSLIMLHRKVMEIFLCPRSHATSVAKNKYSSCY